jgi:hypothetical protein
MLPLPASAPVVAAFEGCPRLMSGTMEHRICGGRGGGGGGCVDAARRAGGRMETRGAVGGAEASGMPPGADRYDLLFSFG